MAASASPSTPASKPDPPRIGHLKRLRHLLPILSSLHDVGCQRDTAANRRLHFDEYVTLVLLQLFNPLIDSMRMLQQASELEKIAGALGVRRFSLGSFSESVRVFDPDKLWEVVRQLGGELNPVNADPRLKSRVPGDLKIFDGTVIDAVAKVAKAAWLPFTDGTTKHAWRLHVEFDFDTGVPASLELTDAVNSGRSDEKNVLRSKLKPDCCYVLDRWYNQFALFDDIHAVGSSYVCRIRENSVFEVNEERLLGEADLAAGVVRDALVTLGSKAANRPDHPVRLVVIEAEPHARRGGRKGKTAGPGNKGTILIATNLPEVPAEIIALIYRHRWAIEIFFRFFKQVLGCRHLLSHKPEGILIQMYCAIIACMMINLWTGQKPGKATVTMLAWYFAGVAGEEEVTRHLQKQQQAALKKKV